MQYWKYFNYNEGMTRGESLEIERSVSLSTMLCDGLLYKVWSETFVWPVSVHIAGTNIKYNSLFNKPVCIPSYFIFNSRYAVHNPSAPAHSIRFQLTLASIFCKLLTFLDAYELLREVATSLLVPVRQSTWKPGPPLHVKLMLVYFFLICRQKSNLLISEKEN